MAVDTTDTYSGPYATNGATTVFPFGFKAMAADELQVVLTAGDGAETIADPALYAVTLNVDGTGALTHGGNVTFAVAPAAGFGLIVASAPSFEQEIQFSDGDRYSAAAVNEANDRAAVRDVYLRGRVERALVAPRGETLGTLPTTLARRNKLMGFDTGGDPLAYNIDAAAIEALAGVEDEIALVSQYANDIPPVAADLSLGAGSRIAAVGADLISGGSKIVVLAADLALGVASKVATVAADLALGASSKIGSAPQAATDAAAARDAAAASAILSATNANASGTQIVSALTQYGSTTIRIVFAIPDTSGRVPFALADDGKAILDLHPSSRAYAFVQSTATASVAAVGASNGSGLNQRAGASTLGSPNTGRPFAYAALDSAARALWGVQDDGTFIIAKYDSRLQSAVGLAESPSGRALAPFPVVEAGQVVGYYGSRKVVLTAEGANSDARCVGQKIAFLSDRFRGAKAPYSMNLDGTNQRAIITEPVIDTLVITGQSNATGEISGAPVSTIAPYPIQGVMLTGGPVLKDATTISPAAVLLPCKETAYETTATGACTAILDSELPYRTNLKLAMVGHAVQGAAYSGLKKGTAPYSDIINQVARVATLAAGMTAVAGAELKTVVRGVLAVHGENDKDNASYAANLAEWQSDLETDILATTGQGEPVYLFLTQVASARYYYPATMDAFLSPLQQLAASNANSRIILVVPQYIFTYVAEVNGSGNVHLSAASNRLQGEYVAKAYHKVIGEGRDWRGVSPKSFVLNSNSVDVVFNVPVAPLVLDTALCTDPGNFGFNYSDASGRTITSVTVQSADTVRITVSGTIGASATLSYAYNNGTAQASGPTAGARGCLRDSDPALSRFDGVTHLYNPCVIFKLALN